MVAGYQVHRTMGNSLVPFHWTMEQSLRLLCLLKFLIQLELL
jgi:hypothetical protein